MPVHYLRTADRPYKYIPVHNSINQRFPEQDRTLLVVTRLASVSISGPTPIDGGTGLREYLDQANASEL